MQENVHFPLACFLIIAEKNAYFSIMTGVNAHPNTADIWDSSYIPELQHKLGQPLGDPIKNGYEYSRSYQYVDVWVNVQTKETKFTWRETPLPVPTNDGVNLALKGTATQSTTDYGGPASRAIDGNTNGNYFANSVTHTAAQNTAWWQVDLGADHSIDEIKIFNRTDCCTNRLSDFTVLVIDAAGNFTYNKTFKSTPSPSLTINAGDVTGKIIRIRSNLASTALSLAEVQVYGAKIACPTFATIQSENFNSMSGILSESTTDTGGGQNIVYIHNGDWSRYNGINLTCATSIQARVSSGTSGGKIEVRLGSVTGTLIGTIPVIGTGSWNSWTTVSINIKAVSGKQNVYLVYTGGSGYLFNVNWVKFNNTTSSAKTSSEKMELDVLGNPVEDMLNIRTSASQTATLDIVDNQGLKVLSQDIKEESTAVDVSKLPAGIYFLRITDGQHVETKKIIKK